MLDLRRPYFELRLNGRSLQASSLRHLLSVELQESQTDLDAVTIQLSVPERPWEVLDLAEPGSTFEVLLGYNGVPLRSVFGDIVEISHSRSTSGPWTLTLQGVDCLHRLKDKQGAEFRDGSHATIISEIASKSGFNVDVQQVNTTGGATLQLEEDFATFLSRLAKAHNYFVRVEKATPLDPRPTLRFGRRSLEALQVPVVCVWGENTEKVDVRYSLEDLISEVVVKGRDYQRDADFEGRANTSALRRISGGETGVEMAARAWGPTQHTVDNTSDPEGTHAQARADATLQERAEKFLTGTVECVGMPEARSGSRLRVVGASWPCSGEFLIEQTTHSFDPGSGYRTTITFYSDSLPPRTGL